MLIAAMFRRLAIVCAAFLAFVNGDNVLHGGETLWSPDMLENIHGDRFQMQNDGNLILYYWDGYFHTRWLTNTNGAGSSPYRLKLELNNNLVVYDSLNTLIWESSTNFGVGNNATLILKNTGNVELYDANNTLLWQTATFDTNNPTTQPAHFISS